jgi:predicted O-methyltransferase YrrM
MSRNRGPQSTVAVVRRLEPGYRPAAADREAAEGERLGLLEQIYDPVSRRGRAPLQAGWRCLELGTGRGSMAPWLAEKVGPTGHVVATDIDVGYLRRLEVPNLEGGRAQHPRGSARAARPWLV